MGAIVLMYFDVFSMKTTHTIIIKAETNDIFNISYQHVLKMN